MISLSDRQLSVLMQAARSLPPSRRDLFLRRAGAMLKLRGRFNDRDVGEIAELALVRLMQRVAAGA